MLTFSSGAASRLRPIYALRNGDARGNRRRQGPETDRRVSAQVPAYLDSRHRSLMRSRLAQAFAKINTG